MAVYVDQLFDTLYAGQRWPYTRACHMWADTVVELHAMADRIGLKRKWFQNRKRFPHYDLTANRRKLAIDCGAIEKSLREHLSEGVKR